MNLQFAMNEYFQGEKVEALVFILSTGLFSLAFSIWLFTEGGSFASFAKGVAIPLLALGLIATTVGGVVGYRTPSQLRQLESGLANHPEVTVQAEIQRMEKVNSAWPKYLALWILFGVIGLTLRVLSKSDFTQGLGIALVFFSGVTLLIDGFAERRAVKYTSHLQAEAQKSSQ